MENTAAENHGGLHQIFIESADHRSSLTQLTPQHLQLVLRAYRDRLAEMSQHDDIAYCALFKNSGPIAGASLEHVHTQLIGMPVVPMDAANELQRMHDRFQQDGTCILCDVLRDELASGKRIVAETSSFVAYCPYASRFSHEVWITPRQHASRFEATSDDLLCELSDVFRDALQKIELVLSNSSYNILFQLAPFDTACEDYYHWRIEICPRLSTAAGFELGSGCFINPTTPENAAQTLRTIV